MPLRWGLRRAPEPAQWPLSPRVLHPGMPSLLPCLAWGRGQASRKLAGCSPHSLHSPQPVQNDRLVSHTLVPAGSPSTRMSLSVVRFPHEGPLGGLGNCWAAQGSRVPPSPRLHPAVLPVCDSAQSPLQGHSEGLGGGGACFSPHRAALLQGGAYEGTRRHGSDVVAARRLPQPQCRPGARLSSAPQRCLLSASAPGHLSA